MKTELKLDEVLAEEEEQIDVEPHYYPADEVDEVEKRRVFGKSHSHILDLLTKEIGDYEILEKVEFTNLSRDVEDLYSQAIDIFAERTEYLEAVVSRIMSDILSGTTRGKVMHNIPGGEKDRLWNRNSEFLVKGLSLVAERSCNRNSEDSRKRLASNFKELRVVGSLLYNALEEYCSLGTEYEECSLRLAKLMLEGGDEADILESKQVLSQLASDLHTPEEDIIIVTHNILKIFQRISAIHRFIFLHHQRLLIKVAKSLTTTHSPDQLLENYQYGVFGLIRAIRDHNPPYNFVGYASGWIKQSILSNMRAVSNNIRVPGNIIQEFAAIERARQKLSSDKQDLDGISEATEKDKEKVQKIYDVISTARTYSLDKEVNHGDESDSAPSSIQDLIPDESTTPDKFTESAEVEKLLAMLNPKEQWVIANFYGLQDYLSRCRKPKCTETTELERIRQLYITTSLRRKRAREVKL